MTDLREIKDLMEKVRDKYKGASIKHIPKEDIKTREKKMMKTLQKNLTLLEEKKADFTAIGRSLSDEGTAEAKKLICQLEDDIEKVDLEINRIKGYILTFSRKEINEAEEEKIEAEARLFTKKIIENTQDTFKIKDCIRLLDSSGYSKKGKLIGYEDFEEHIETFSLEELKKFIRLLVNHTHQAAYHIPKETVEDFLQFNKK